MENTVSSKAEIYEERISAMEDMLQRTTDYMGKVQSELEASKTKVEEKSRSIEDSIKYASVIQKAILPNVQSFDYNFEKLFIHKQKEDIGGDFPFIFETEDLIYIAAIDCTGRGVPGSLISMSASFILKQVINTDLHKPNAGNIFSNFNKSFYNHFHFFQNKHDKRVKIGMDMALVVYNKKHHSFSIVEPEDLSTMWLEID